MTTDREMLEFAAKACGIDLQFKVLMWDTGEEYPCYLDNESVSVCGSREVVIKWNPLTSSADCAAMCAKLMIGTLWISGMDAAHALTDDYEVTALTKDHNNDREAAWRYAATMVAAKIGGMK